MNQITALWVYRPGFQILRVPLPSQYIKSFILFSKIYKGDIEYSELLKKKCLVWAYISIWNGLLWLKCLPVSVLYLNMKWDLKTIVHSERDYSTVQSCPMHSSWLPKPHRALSQLLLNHPNTNPEVLSGGVLPKPSFCSPNSFQC